ncbi:MAG: acyl-CoA thioesterase [Elusimicrobia bacterium]|nr:acyl-CoA thioesterase [Elusimicrobiota bacterium]
MPKTNSQHAKPVRASKAVLSGLMMPQDANPMGKVFGGSILKLIDNVAFVAAARHAGTSNCVTISMDKIDFKQPIEIGELVILEAKLHFTGRSSIVVGVNVYTENLDTGHRRQTNSCLVTFVAVDDKGKPREVPRLRPETEEEKQIYHQAEIRYQNRKNKIVRSRLPSGE